MMKLFHFLFLPLLCASMLGCSDNGRADLICPNIGPIIGNIEINGLSLPLHSAEISYNETPNLHTHYFDITANRGNCEGTLSFTFFASTPKSETLPGTYTIIESITFTAHKVSSFNLIDKTFEPFIYQRKIGIDGEVSVIPHGPDDYTIYIDALLDTEEKVVVSLRYQF